MTHSDSSALHPAPAIDRVMQHSAPRAPRALAAVGERVLIVDLDPQGNASTGLGIDRKSRRLSTYDVLIGEALLRDAVMATAVPHLSIAPSTLDLSGLELQVSQEHDRAMRLRNALARLNHGETD